VARKLTMEQLIRGGVIDALKMRHIGFPDRMPYKNFCDEFSLLEHGRDNDKKGPEGSGNRHPDIDRWSRCAYRRV
jgi:myosin heavy subunit